MFKFQSGSYRLERKQDTSFQICICTLLIFIALCALISTSLILVKINRKANNSTKTDESEKQEAWSLPKLGISSSTESSKKALFYTDVSTSAIQYTKYDDIDTEMLQTSNFIRNIDISTLTSSGSKDSVSTLITEATTSASENTIAELRSRDSEMNWSTLVPRTVNHTNKITELPETTSISSAIRNHLSTQMIITKKNASAKLQSICKTSHCKSSAIQILHRMNFAADPCEDFYDFTCGGSFSDRERVRQQQQWRIDDKEDPADTAWKRILQQLQPHSQGQGAPASSRQRFGDFHRNCVSAGYEFPYAARLQSVKTILKEHGLDQFMKPKTPQESVDLANLFAVMALTKTNPLFDFSIYLNTESTYELELVIPLNSVELEDCLEDLYVNHTFIKSFSPWRPMISRIRKRCLDELQQINTNQTLINLPNLYTTIYTKCQTEYRRKYSDDVEYVNKDINLVNHDHVETLQWDLKEMHDYLNKMYGSMEHYYSNGVNTVILSIKELQTTYPLIDWSAFAEKLSLPGSLRLKIPAIVGEVLAYYSEKPAWNLYNILLGQFTHNLYENIIFGHYSEKACSDMTMGLYPELASVLFKQTFTMEELEYKDELLDELTQPLKKNLTAAFQSSQWLDERTKTFLVNQLENLKVEMTGEDHMPPEEEIIVDNDSNVKDFFQRLVHRIISIQRQKLKLVSAEYSSTQIIGNFVNTFDVRPKIIFQESIIVVPLGIIPSQDRNDAPRYHHMTTLGMAIAREMGRRFDLNGILKEAALPKYVEMILTKLGSQNNELLPKEFAANNEKYQIDKMNWNLSLNTRIAENTAFRLIGDMFEAYEHKDTIILPWIRELYDNEQLYYITMAQGFCERESRAALALGVQEHATLPAPLRLQNMVAHSQGFATVFRCPVGSRHNNNPVKLQFPHLMDIAIDENDVDYETE